MDLQLEGAAVCVSGGTKGLGFSCAMAFAAEKARIVITGRDQNALDETVDALKAAGSPDAYGYRCELPDLDQIEGLFRSIDARWGGLNTLVNVAGPTAAQHFGHAFEDVSEESWDYFMQMGLMSVVRCTRLAIPLMRKAGWGRIVNISSQSARIAGPGETAYMTVKAAINAFSKNIAWPLSKEDILVNSVTPGAIATDATTQAMIAMGAVEKGYDPGDLESVGKFIADFASPRARGAIGRAALPDEFVAPIILLGSRLNTFMVGSNVAIDGGTDYSTG